MIIGIDEVGRGCWAGPLVACAAILKTELVGLTDSKLLSARQRQYYFDLLVSQSQYGLGWVFPVELDNIGLTEAVRRAMRRAYDALAIDAQDIIIDGNINYLPELKNSRAVIKADLLHPVVSAASIIAKVTRDAYMREQAQQYPEYGFEAHVGYGTGQHMIALKKHGVTSMHRKSFKPVRAFLV